MPTGLQRGGKLDQQHDIAAMDHRLQPTYLRVGEHVWIAGPILTSSGTLAWRFCREVQAE